MFSVTSPVAMTVRVRAFLILVASATTHAFFDEAVDVLRLGKEIGEEVMESWDIIGKPFNVSGGVELPIIRRRERLVLSRLAHISRSIQRLELAIEKNGAIAMLLAKASSRGAKLELRLHEMADLLSRVTSADRQMREYVRLQRELEQSTLQDFAEWCVSHDRGALAGLLERVHSLIAPPYKHLLGGGLLQLILEDLQQQGDKTLADNSMNMIVSKVDNSSQTTGIDRVSQTKSIVGLMHSDDSDFTTT